MAHLFPELNARLQPKLQKELRPGARVVSHFFPVGDWPQAGFAMVEVSGQQHPVYLYVVR